MNRYLIGNRDWDDVSLEVKSTFYYFVFNFQKSKADLTPNLIWLDPELCEIIVNRYMGDIMRSKIQKQRYSLIDRQKLTAFFGIKDNEPLSEDYRLWVEEVLKNESNQRDSKWTESIGACPAKSGFFNLTGVVLKK